MILKKSQMGNSHGIPFQENMADGELEIDNESNYLYYFHDDSGRQFENQGEIDISTVLSLSTKLTT